MQESIKRQLQRLAGSSRVHIAVMSEPFLGYVLEGKKTIESRFSLHKIAPYQKVQAGDVVFMKAGPIVGCFTVSWVKSYDLSNYRIQDIEQRYGKGVCGDAAFWKVKATKRYVTLMGITDIKRLTPVRIEKHDRRAWIAL